MKTPTVFTRQPITMQGRLNIINCTLLVDHSTAPLPDCTVVIDGGIIIAAGPSAAQAGPGTTVIDAGGKLLMPGLINGHNHCAMTLFRGLADDLDLATWLHQHIFPAEAAHVDPEMVYWCTMLAAAEMIRSGTTTVADGYFFSGKAAQALHDSGMRAVVAHGIVDFPAPSVPDPSKNIETVERFLDEWQQRSPRVAPAVFAHAPYTCSPQTLRRAKELADRRNARFFIHIAETRSEQQSIIDPQGPTPLTHLEALGILDPNCVCVHAVWIDEYDLDRLARSGASVVTCPQSNAKLGSGIAPIAAMRQRAIPVGIGTDGCASNNSLDLFREMDLLAKIQKASTLEATAMPAGEVLRCATAGGAHVLGLTGGRIVPGSPADLVLIDTRAPHLTPFYNQDLLVYAATGSDVDTVIIDGQVVMRDRKITAFDLDQVYRQVQRYAAGLGSLRLLRR